MKKTILEMLEMAASRWGSLPYTMRKTDRGYVATGFAETRDAARAFAAWLLLSGFEPGDRMAVLGEGSPEWVESEYGAFCAGLVTVPLSIKLTVDEILFRVNHSESRLIVTTRNFLSKTLDVIARAENPDMAIVYLDEDAQRAAAAVAAWSADHRDRGRSPRFTSLADAIAAGNAALGAEASGSAGSARGGGAAARLDSIREATVESTIAMISYTSGTMSNPKGIMLSHLNLWTNSHDVFASFYTPRYKLYLMLPADHAFTHVCGIFTALWCGVSLWFLDGRGGGMAMLRNIPVNMLDSAPHFFFTVPAIGTNYMKKILSGVKEKGPVVEKLFRAGIKAGERWIGDGFNRPSFATRARAFLPYFLAKTFLFGPIRAKAFGKTIEFSVCGGSKIDLKQQRFFAALGVPLLPGYGLTEASPVISSNLPSCHKFGTMGRLFPSVQCVIMDEKGNPLPPRQIGEITATGDSVMVGYYKNPEATAVALRNGRLWTGDLGFMDEDGFLTVVGRTRSLLVSESGDKCSPELIEETIMASTDLIEQMMAWCLYRKTVCALVCLDMARTKDFIERRSIKSAEELCAALQEEFYAFRKSESPRQVQARWEPTVFQIVEREFGEHNGTINSTMKLVRRKVETEYKDSIEYSYTGEGSATVNPRNIAALKKLFGL